MKPNALTSIVVIALALVSCQRRFYGGAEPSAATPFEGPESKDCQTLHVLPSPDPNDVKELRYLWFDAACHARSAVLLPNTQRDANGHFGGYMREYTYDANGVSRRCVGSNAEHPGFGFLVNHYGTTSSSSLRRPGSGTRTVFSGRHHAIHEFTWDYPIDKRNVHATVHWFFATGHDNPVWSVTYDMSDVPVNALKADSRAPYGDLQWDGGAQAPVDGVGWGDKYQFTSLDTPLTMQSGWDYNVRNVVPFDREWSVRADAEMGLVQTQSTIQHGGGGFWFYEKWGERHAKGPMPDVWNWPYQLNQYQLQSDPTSKLLAWGTNYGAVGQLTYKGYGGDETFTGYPYQSYATYIVLDLHSKDPVLHQVRSVEGAQSADLVGEDDVSVLRQGPAGVGRKDELPYTPDGYNPVYGTWELKAHNTESLSWKLRLKDRRALDAPTFVVHNWNAKAPTSVRVNGVELRPDTEFYASVDGAAHALWLTIPWTFRGTTSIELGEREPAIRLHRENF